MLKNKRKRNELQEIKCMDSAPAQDRYLLGGRMWGKE